MSRTLVISEVFPPRTGGSGRWLWEMYRRWPAGSVHVLAGEHASSAIFDAAQPMPVERMNLTFESWGLVGYREVRRYTTAYRRIVRVLKDRQIAQIHCGRILPEGLLAWMMHMRHHVPYACYVHGEELNTAASSRELTFLARRVLSSARVLIANSVNTARVLVNEWSVPAAKVEIVNPGVDADSFLPALPDDRTRHRLGWQDRRVILTVGRLQARKGHAKLIEALPAILQQVPDALYAIVGAGETRNELEALVKSLGLSDHVQFLGELDEKELRHCMQQCDLFALPNVQIRGDFEGFGMVLVEAAACGKPVLAGRSGGTGEAMRDGETGRLVNCENKRELAATVAELLKDESLRQHMGAAGRRWVERKFDWPMITRQAQGIFEERFGRITQQMAA